MLVGRCHLLIPNSVVELEHIHPSGKNNFQFCRCHVHSQCGQLLLDSHLLLLLLCDMLELGLPVDLQGEIPPTTDFLAQQGARDFPAPVDKYSRTETGLSHMAGPYSNNLFFVPLSCFPNEH